MSERHPLPEFAGIVPLSEWKKLPFEPGIYVFFDDETIYYVGRSESIKSRIMTHRYTSPFGKDELSRGMKIGWIEMPYRPDTIRKEREFIYLLQPVFNSGRDKKYEPFSLHAERMRRQEASQW